VARTPAPHADAAIRIARWNSRSATSELRMSSAFADTSIRAIGACNTSVLPTPFRQFSMASRNRKDSSDSRTSMIC
jgi:hypothetical protein